MSRNNVTYSQLSPTPTKGFHLNANNLASLNISTSELSVETTFKQSWVNRGWTLESFDTEQQANRKLDWWQGKVDM
jgi:hypothetical protein